MASWWETDPVVQDQPKFDTELTPSEESEYRKWKARVAPTDDGTDYDFRGAFKARVSPDPETGHWPDTFKKPNHPTFSDQSVYARVAPDRAGHWDGDTFIPASSDWWKSDPVIAEEPSDTSAQVTPDHSPKWNAAQTDMQRRAAFAGLPSTADSRQRLIDAIGRAETAGFKTRHFIGLPNEPTGDRGVTRDIENLVASLKQQEASLPPGQQRDAISKQRQYWEYEARTGMTAEEWASQTGEHDPLYPEEQSQPQTAADEQQAKPEPLSFTGELRSGHYLNALAVALAKARDIGTEAVSPIDSQLSQTLFGQTTASMRPEQIAPPLISPEAARQIVGQLPAWAGGNTSIGRGVAEGTAGTLSAFSAPGALAQLPAFAVPGFAETYVLNVIHDLPDQGRKLMDAANKYGWQSKEVAQLATEYGIQDLTAFLAGKTSTTARFIKAEPRAESPKPNPQAVPMARETQAPSGESLTKTPSEMVREGPPSAEDAKGLPISRPVTQRFVQPEGAPIVPESETTAAITRDALVWRNELLREGQKLGEQARLMGQMGQPIPKPLADRIAEINTELARGFQPKPQEHYELRGETPDAPIETEPVKTTEQVAVQSDIAAAPRSPVRSADNRTQSETVSPSGVVRQSEAAFVPESVSRAESSTAESGDASAMPEANAASVPVMITKRMEAELRARGITEEQINSMTPAEAHDILKAEPTAPSPDIQEAPVQETTTGVANRVLKAEAETGKIEPVEPGEGMSWQEMVDLGREKLNAGADPQMIARRFERNGRISAEDFAVVRAERERLAGETMAAENAVRQNPNDVNARNNYNAARQTETEWVRNVVQPAKTATSDIFRGMQGEAPIDPTTFAGLRRAVLDIHGRDVAPNEVGTLSAISERTRRAVAESSESLQRAATAVENTLGRKVKPRSIDELREHLANRIRELTPC